MGRHSCCYKQKLRKGLWSPEEDEKLLNHITQYGHGCWSSVPKLAGLQRCGKSCRLRWINYLRPDLKRGAFSDEEENLIIELHAHLGNRWSQIAAQLPGRTDNEIKNFWNSSLKKKLRQKGIDPNTHKPIPEPPPVESKPAEEEEEEEKTTGTGFMSDYVDPLFNQFLHCDTIASLLPPFPSSVLPYPSIYNKPIFASEGLGYWGDAGSSSISSGNSSGSADLQSNHSSFYADNPGNNNAGTIFDEFRWSELLHSAGAPIFGEVKAESRLDMDDGYPYYDDDLTRISAAAFREM